MSSDHTPPLWPIAWQGALMAPLILLLAVGASLLWYRTGWDRDPHWKEAWRHAHTPWIAMERWVHFRWIHFDAQYWNVPVRLDQGPIVLEGRPPDAPYWSITWYAGTEVHPSISSETVHLEPDGTYRIHIAEHAEVPNWIPTEPGAKRAVIYLRVYEPADTWPVELPEVRQGGERLASGGML